MVMAIIYANFFDYEFQHINILYKSEEIEFPLLC